MGLRRNCLVLTASAAVLALPATASATSTANLWVDTDGGTCSRSASPVAYNNATACSALDVAYASASSGDVVGWKGGSYPAQSLFGLTTKTITFESAAGEAVEVGGLALYDADRITIRGDNSSGRTKWIDSTTGWDIDGQGLNTDDVNTDDTLEYIKARNTNPGSQGAVFVRASQGLTIRHSEVGPSDPDDGMKFWQPNPGINADADNTDVLVEDLYLHDISHDDDPAAHDDGISIQGCMSCTFRYVRGHNLGTIGFFPDGFGDPDDEGTVTLENSMLAGSQDYGYYAVQAGTWEGTLNFRNNSFGQAAYVGASAPTTNWVGNLWTDFADFSCSTLAGAAAVFKYNVYPETCSGADGTNLQVATIASEVVDPTNSSSFDAHLLSGSGAIDRTGFTLLNGCAATDIDLGSRPNNSLCDAGADEYGAP